MKTIQKIHARDLMRTQVLKLSPNMPIPRALELFEDHKISGAPVVDTSGRVLGVLSATDVTRSERLGGQSTLQTQPRGLIARDGDDEWDDEHAEEDLLSIEDWGPETASGPTVADWMNPGVIAVAPDCTLPHLCKTLLDNGVHRVLVMEHGTLLGIVTTTDVVRCVAGA